MDYLSKAISLSFLLHSTLLCGVVVLSRSAALVTPQLVIDFSIESAHVITKTSEEPSRPAAEAENKTAEPVAMPPVENEQNHENKNSEENPRLPKTLAHPKKNAVPKEIANGLKIPEVIKKKPVEPDSTTSDTIKQEYSLTDQVAAATSPVDSEQRQTTVQATSQVQTNSESQMPNQALTKNNGTKSIQNKQEPFVANHFEYIRKLIMQNLSFPAAARKMGWYGKLVVSFIIREDGNVEDINIVSGSGHDMLDANVITAINKTVPFPKPPVRAQITLPIIYNLR